MQYLKAAMRVSRLILMLFLVAQVCDGLFTYVAVTSLGIAAEGNLILSTWMTLVGPVPTLVVAKAVAASAGVLVYTRGLHSVLAGLTAFYMAVAVGPWLFVYYNWP